MSVFKGSDIIYDNGRLNMDRYSVNAIVPHISDITREIEYFYAWEIHSIKDAHIPIVLINNLEI